MNENAKQPTQEEIKEFWDDVAKDEERREKAFEQALDDLDKGV